MGTFGLFWLLIFDGIHLARRHNMVTQIRQWAEFIAWLWTCKAVTFVKMPCMYQSCQYLRSFQHDKPGPCFDGLAGYVKSRKNFSTAWGPLVWHLTTWVALAKEINLLKGNYWLCSLTLAEVQRKPSSALVDEGPLTDLRGICGPGRADGGPPVGTCPLD